MFGWLETRVYHTDLYEACLRIAPSTTTTHLAPQSNVDHGVSSWRANHWSSMPSTRVVMPFIPRVLPFVSQIDSPPLGNTNGVLLSSIEQPNFKGLAWGRFRIRLSNSPTTTTSPNPSQKQHQNLVPSSNPLSLAKNILSIHRSFSAPSLSPCQPIEAATDRFVINSLRPDIGRIYQGGKIFTEENTKSKTPRNQKRPGSGLGWRL